MERSNNRLHIVYVDQRIRYRHPDHDYIRTVMTDSRVPDNTNKFAHYKKWFTGDNEEDFVTYSQRFAAWADNRKAHYDAARPTVSAETRLYPRLRAGR